MQLIPPHRSKCQCCACEHPPTEPHNAQSLYYHFWFDEKYARAPTWADAMAHCTEDVQKKWMTYFAKLGIDIYSTDLTGNIKSAKELEDRLNE